MKTLLSFSACLAVAGFATVPALAAKEVGGVISANTTWRAADGPFLLTSGVTVADGVTLTIEPGTAVHLSTNVDLLITNGGRMLAQGTASAPIRITSPPRVLTRWGGIIVCGDEGTPETRIEHAYIEGNNFSAIYSPGGTLVVDHVSFGSPDRQYLSLDGASFVVSECHFPAATGTFELFHGTRGIKEGGRGIVRRCFFGSTKGYSDVIDFTGGNRDRKQPILEVYNNVFAGSNDDAIDLDGTDAWVEGNIFLHIHKNGTPDTASAISGGNNRRLTSQVTVIGNLFYDCDQAATAKQGNFFTMINNTIVHMTKAGGEDYASGAVCARDTEPEVTTFGEGIYLEGNIIADIEQLVRNYAKGETAVTFVNNLLPVAWDGPGTGNTVGDPELKHIPQLKETTFTNWASAQILREWFSPQPGSPALGSGPNGRDRGGVIPLGVSVSGEPSGTTEQTSATLTAGWARKGSGIPEDGWPAGAGYTHYKWRLDGGSWSAETPMDTPISLAGLVAGEHRVEVIGKRDSGRYQNDPALGSDAIVTKSRAWTVRSK